VPFTPQVAAPASWHSPSGSVVAVTAVQLPSAAPVLAAAHASQVESQACSQHTPSTQNPDAQSVAAEHAAP
jgi:hypothetical protein